MPVRKPDILFIVLDTLRRDRLSIYGHAQETSPGFDAFAGRAALFERAVAPAQWTIPAHGSLFTGLYPGAHGLTQSNSVLSEMNLTLAEILRSGGYHTIAFCNNPLVGVLNNGLQRGFDSFYNYATAIPYRPYDHHKSALRRRFTRWFRPYARSMGNAFAQSDALFRAALHPLLTPIWSKYINFKGSTGVSLDDLAAYWGDYHRGGAEKPLFAFVNLMGAHLPYHPPRDLVERFAPELKGDRQAYTFMRRFNADGAAWAAPPDEPYSELQTRTLNAFYNAEVAYQDMLLSRLLDALRASGALENTAVVLMADHGESHGEHAIVGHGFNVYQELVHVPLAIHVPGMTPGQRIGVNVSTRRVFHTLLDLAGVPNLLDAHDPNADIAGLSLVNLLKDGSGRDVESATAFSEAYPPLTFLNVLEHRSPSVIERLRLRLVRRALYAGDRKLVAEGDRVEGLFDLAGDPTESRDLQGGRAAEAEALLRQLSAFAGAHSQAYRPEPGEVSEEVVEHLRALGYIE
ncbi:MAG: sulfatase [Anaerolineae bacterium]|nr:sulfatase [Anaerolineae bacterium]